MIYMVLNDGVFKYEYNVMWDKFKLNKHYKKRWGLTTEKIIANDNSGNWEIESSVVNL